MAAAEEVDLCSAGGTPEPVSAPHVSTFDSPATVPSSASSSSASTDGEVSNNSGFVVVAKPIMTVRQFADWIRHVRLPSAEAVLCQGTIGGVEGTSTRTVDEDTVHVLVSRRSFLNDIVRSFKGAIDDCGFVEETGWRRLWSQFLRDFPREDLSIDGERIVVGSPATTPGTATAHDGAEGDESGIAETGHATTSALEAAVLAPLRAFLARRIPPHVMAAGLSAPSPPPRTALGSIVDAPAMGSLSTWAGAPFSWIKHTVAYGLQKAKSPASSKRTSPAGSGQATPQAPPLAAAAKRPTLLSEDTEVGLEAVPGRPFHVDGVRTEADVVEDYARLVILMSQQSALALPFEMVHAQFCGDISSELFVGEVAPSDPHVKHSGMRVSLTSSPDRDKGARLTVSKVFRVFSVGEGAGITLFYVKMLVDMDLFVSGSDDTVSLTWKVEGAASSDPASRVSGPTSAAGGQQAAVVAAASPPPSPPASANNESRRRCDCLGASGGFHKPTCSYNSSN